MEEATVMFLAATTLIITSLREWRGEVVTSGVLALAMHPLLEVVVATPAVTTTGVMGVDKTVATVDALQLTTSVEVVPDQTMPPMTAMVAQHMANLGIAMEGQATINSAASCCPFFFFLSRAGIEERQRHFFINESLHHAHHHPSSIYHQCLA